jgi:hypothetical protein
MPLLQVDGILPLPPESEARWVPVVPLCRVDLAKRMRSPARRSFSAVVHCSKALFQRRLLEAGSGKRALRWLIRNRSERTGLNGLAGNERRRHGPDASRKDDTHLVHGSTSPLSDKSPTVVSALLETAELSSAASYTKRSPEQPLIPLLQ